MTIDKDKKYIVRSVGAGLFFGYITEKDGGEVTMKEARNLWKWAGASNVNELAQTGTQRPDDCMFTMPLDEVVVRNGTTFAHGENIREAMSALRDKLYDDMSEDERIEAFWKEHNWDDEYTVEDFYRWHHILTGSCDMGRRQFFEQHNLTMEEKHNVAWFIDLTKNAYGGDVIVRLKARPYDKKY